MTNYVKRILYVDAEESSRVNPLFYPFLVATFFYGLGFGAFSEWDGVSKSSLFQAMYADHPLMPFCWGVLAFFAGAFALILLLTRKRGILGEIAAMFGFLVWMYAAWIYAQGEYWLVLVTVTGPNVYFWGWYYTRVKWWERQKKMGLLVDAG